MRLQKIVKTMDTGKEVTSIEIIQDGQHITTADGNEVIARYLTSSQWYSWQGMLWSMLCLTGGPLIELSPPQWLSVTVNPARLPCTRDQHTAIDMAPCGTGCER